MENFWDFNVWSAFNILAVLLISLLVANVLRRSIKFLRNSLIPVSVLAGALLLLVASVYKLITGEVMFDTAFFGGSGSVSLEIITYHCLALGFIASTFKPSGQKLNKKRTSEIFNTGLQTVSTYLIQAIVGLGISLLAILAIPSFFKAAGILLPFGYGQGTGQALNYGGIFETEYGFDGGKSFGLTIAALGFISASIGGVIHLNILKKKGKIKVLDKKDAALKSEDIESENEIPMQESIDKLTIQIALIALAYVVTFLLMFGLGKLVPGMKSVIFGFNFLLGVISATLIKLLMNWLKKIKVIKKDYVNSFLMTRASNFFFDLMVVAGIAAIRLSALKNYWGVIIIMAVAGLLVTYFYNLLVSRTLFKDYPEEQFLMMYGMLTGTACTGIILLREIDGEFKTPAAENMVYQNFPAIVFGFPMMLLVTLAPTKPIMTLLILVGLLAFIVILLFRSKIFRFKKKAATSAPDANVVENVTVEESGSSGETEE
ncbi:MAG: hypothetical protein J6X47_09575 [Clostridia bacterium]|nr:hypothetical protein [Clostridia bacterium]